MLCYSICNICRALECCLVSLTILGRWVANEERFAAVGAVRSYFDQVVQDCASFMLKMFELQYVSVGKEARAIAVEKDLGYLYL